MLILIKETGAAMVILDRTDLKAKKLSGIKKAFT